ncbi:MAG: beta-ketoacyl synthase chain length factor [Betaproteobacteria bacterium]
MSDLRAVVLGVRQLIRLGENGPHLKSVVSSLSAPITRWSKWESRVSPDGTLLSPDVSFVEPMLRRRLSSLARMTLRVAYDCAWDIPGVRFVYASRHGELTRTTTMLESIADKETLSPALFSMSVLNASAGLFSMLQGNVAPSTAVSAGDSSFSYGLMEACMQLADNPERPVLFIYADEPAPAVYGVNELSGCEAHAVGCLLESSAAMRINCVSTREESDSSEEVQSRAFLRCLDQGQASWHGSGLTWSWTKSA